VKLTIACVALFVSLAGVSYGVATGFIDSREIRNNTIQSRDVHNNSLRTQDIRNDAVRGSDVRDSALHGDDVASNTLTDADIGEASLQRVPNAAQADSAPAVSVMKRIPHTSFHAAYDPPVTLLTHGPLTLIADCERTGTGSDTSAWVQVQTTEAGAAAGTIEVPDLNPGAPVTIAELIAPFPATTKSTSTIFAMAGGKGLTGQINMSAIAVGAGGYFCGFSGRVVLEG
jgi:hypothetical protein